MGEVRHDEEMHNAWQRDQDVHNFHSGMQPNAGGHWQGNGGQHQGQNGGGHQQQNGWGH
jgi:hypothetical protein